ncbi:MAG: amidohydrolase family protein [Candidatus Aminicenantes bacterium]|nr:amidohydrolase family protein [Candidatus Aminicenantes bacterium]NIM80246.1 amidohydrolase family protein [Candidatus Aminicenantes bacterium]NIN19596.1 amidohydrolase family protein [Candidatus Aminicenantes bacterium]NIN43480.1 amidohydrolase family protein [Candidatus Aminicenantes bacterium]NIN86225.1 amidohydrolase family protein [Candidatus Aminicenantes bacterium]
MKNKTYFITFVIVSVMVLFCASGLFGKKKYDIIIKNGTIVDGLGGKPFQADVGIRKGKIAKLGKLKTKKAKKVIDASNLMVCPGFIDLHTHTDDDILEQPNAHNYIRQGVTTVLGGNCGGSFYPIGEFLEKVEQGKIALNFCTLVGHNTIRRNVMGNIDREPTEEEMMQMKQMVEKAMQDGAVGISTGLKYMPGAYAKTEEVIELAKVAAKYRSVYATHMREEGLGILEAVNETIEIGKLAKIPVHISHHKIASKDRWGSSVKTLAMVDKARKDGIDVTLDQYPYPATSTGLTILFPSWALEGNPKEWKKRWNDPKVKPRLIEDIINNIKHDRGGSDLNRIMIARYSPEPELEGLTIAKILKNKGIPETFENGVEQIIQLQVKTMEMEGRVQAIYFCLSDEDIKRIIKHPLTSHASDGGITTFNVGNPHPRNYGTFPRVLRLYVREKGILSFEAAIRKMSFLPSRRLGLKKRGCIKKGFYADIAIIDPSSVSDTATWENPHNYPEGIPYVLVNGQLVVENSKITGAFPGMVIYGKGHKK